MQGRARQSDTRLWLVWRPQAQSPLMPRGQRQPLLFNTWSCHQVTLVAPVAQLEEKGSPTVQTKPGVSWSAPKICQGKQARCSQGCKVSGMCPVSPPVSEQPQGRCSPLPCATQQAAARATASSHRKEGMAFRLLTTGRWIQRLITKQG